MKRNRKRLFLAAWWAVLFSGTARAGEKKTAQELLPARTALFLEIAHVEQGLEKLKGSALGDILAEPECKEFLDPILQRFRVSLGEEGEAVKVALSDLIAAFRGQIALGFVPPEPKLGQAPDLLIIADVSDAAAVNRLLAALAGIVQEARGQAQEIDLGKAKGKTFAWPGGPPLTVCLHENRLVLFTNPAGPGKAVLERLSGAEAGDDCLAKNPRYRKCLAQAGAGELNLFLDSPANLLSMFVPLFAPRESQEVLGVLSALGAMNLDGVHVSCAVRGKSLRRTACFLLRGERRGLWKLISGEPLSRELLRCVPPNAAGFFAFRARPDQVFPLVREVAGTIDPQHGIEELQKVLAEAGDALGGVDLEKDLLGALDEEVLFTSFSAPASSILSLGHGLTLIWKLKNPAALEDALGKLEGALGKLETAALKMFEVTQAGAANAPIFGALEYRGTKVHYLSLAGAGEGPAWSIVGGKLVLSMTVGAVKRALDGFASGRSLLDEPACQEALLRLGADPKSTGLAYWFSPAGCAGGVDGARILGSLTALLNLTGKVDTGIDMGRFPRQEVFLKHVFPAVWHCRLDDDGLLVVADGPGVPALSAGAGAVAAVGIIAAIAVPQLMVSKIAANEAAAVANCKAYATAQETFRRTDWDADGFREYALAIGKRGLKHYADVVKPEEGREEANTLFDCRGNFLDEAFVAAEGGGEDARPKGGYFFKCLHGKDEPGDFLTAPPGGEVKNNLTRRYGLLAWPAEYGATGRRVFFIESKGTVFARDFGSQEATLEFVKSCRTVPPDAELGVKWIADE